jgi:hypothetical protein
MGTIFEVRGEGHSESKVISYGVRRTRAEAEELLKKSRARVVAVGGKVDRWWIEEVDTTGLFEIPARPTPRERFTTRVEPRSEPGQWQTVHVGVLDGDEVVWGRLWGDDSSWKVQYLDLSEIRHGRIRREERFGYLRLATRPDVVGKAFIRLWSWAGKRKVEFAVQETYDLLTGEHIDEKPCD